MTVSDLSILLRISRQAIYKRLYNQKNAAELLRHGEFTSLGLVWIQKTYFSSTDNKDIQPDNTNQVEQLIRDNRLLRQEFVELMGTARKLIDDEQSAKLPVVLEHKKFETRTPLAERLAWAKEQSLKTLSPKRCKKKNG